ncbi:MAG: hypothetical protein J6B10_00110 [Lachnospiraceae bacterium]|nr:hypothetical protein [Lachnospiraceae bacterium]
MVVDLFPKYVWRKKEEEQYILSCFPECRMKLDEGEYRLMADLMEKVGVVIPIVERTETEKVSFQEPTEMYQRLEVLLKWINEWEVLPTPEWEELVKNDSARRRQMVKKTLISIYDYSRNGYYAAVRP